MKLRLPAVLVCLLAGVPASAAGGPQNAPLQDLKGKSWPLEKIRGKKFVVVVAAGSSCPVLRKYVPTLNELSKKWKDSGVSFFLVDEARHDDLIAFEKEFRSYKLNFPAFLDQKQALAKSLGFTVSAEVAILSADGKALIYKGAIDDQFSAAGGKPAAQHHFLDENLEAAIGGRPLPFPSTRAFGCTITVD